MKKVIISIGRFLRLFSILLLLAIGLVQGSMFLGEISGNMIPLLKNGEIWRFIFMGELFILVLAAVVLTSVLYLSFIAALIFAKNGSISRDLWRSLFWSFDLFKK